MQKQSNKPDKEIAALAKQLNSNNVEERDRAERQLRTMGPDRIEVLVALLQYEVRQTKHRRSSEIARIGGQLFLFAMLSMIVIGDSDIASLLFCMYMLMLVSIICRVLATYKVTPAQQSVVYLLADCYNDVSIAGPLVEALEFRDGPTRRAAEVALVGLLPRLQEADASLLDAKQRSILYRALFSNNWVFARAVLQGLKQIGETGAIPYVQKLADGAGGAARDTKLKQAAGECLLFLQQRAEQERNPQTLLRASASNPSAGSLLRPTQSVDSSNAHQLLRAGGA